MNPTTAHGGPAFPSQTSAYYYHGMFLRDYFAAKAFPAAYLAACKEMEETGYPEDWRYGVAQDAYMCADAMLRAREVKT
jgi:hypothetical protein